MTQTPVATLKNIATELRIDSILSTTEGRQRTPDHLHVGRRDRGRAVLRGDALRPEGPAESRQRSLRAVEGPRRADPLRGLGARPASFPREELLKLRRLDSDLEGHPTPRLPFVDVATGSLGQGICAAVGIALNARRIQSDYRTYVLLGDGEIGGRLGLGSRATSRCYHKLDNLCGIVDVNGLGQSHADAVRPHMEEIAGRWRAFGWHALVVDGHDVDGAAHGVWRRRARRRASRR